MQTFVQLQWMKVLILEILRSSMYTYVRLMTILKYMNPNKIENITTDGCPSMIGDKKDGFCKLFSNAYPDHKVTFPHCIIHQEVLCKKVLGLERVTGVVNFIHGLKLQHRKFKKLLQEENGAYGDVH